MTLKHFAVTLRHALATIAPRLIIGLERATPASRLQLGDRAAAQQDIEAEAETANALIAHLARKKARRTSPSLVPKKPHINDYTTDLETVLKPVNDYADRMGG